MPPKLVMTMHPMSAYLSETLSRDRQITAARVTIARVPKTLLKVIES